MIETAAKVVDASALAAVLFGESEAVDVGPRLVDATLIAPPLLPFELANVCLTKIRRSPERRGQLLHGFGRFDRLDVELVAIDVAAALRLGDSAGLTVYDASYLLLAQTTGFELVTLDRRLAAAYALSPGTP